MRRQSLIFWIIVFAAFIIPAVLAVILGRLGLGWFTLIGVLLVAAAAYILIRTGLARRYTRDLQRRLPTPPERELIAHARRPTAVVGLIVLGLALTAVIVFAVLNTSLSGAEEAPLMPTATPELALTPAPADDNTTARIVNPLSDLSLPVMLLVAGIVTLLIVYTLMQLQKDAETAAEAADPTPAQPSPPPSPLADAAEEELNWRELLSADDDDDDLSVWLDGLTEDEDRQH